MGNTLRCTDCGVHFLVAEKRCHYCGSGPVETNRDSCRTCGAQLSDASPSCPRCGSEDVRPVPAGNP